MYCAAMGRTSRDQMEHTPSDGRTDLVGEPARQPLQLNRGHHIDIRDQQRYQDTSYWTRSGSLRIVHCPRGILYSDRLFVVDTTLPDRLLSVASIYMACADVYDGNQVASRQREGQEDWQARRMEFKAVVLFHTIL